MAFCVSPTHASTFSRGEEAARTLIKLAHGDKRLRDDGRME
jgi:hypothetical protein